MKTVAYGSCSRSISRSPKLPLYLTNRVHVAVRLFSNRSQMTPKCGKNNKVAHEAVFECVTAVSFHILTSSVIYYCREARKHGIYLFYIVKKHTTSDKLFYFKTFQLNPKGSFCPPWQTRKKPFDVICCLYKMKQFQWLLRVAKELSLFQENHATINLNLATLLRYPWNENSEIYKS